MVTKKNLTLGAAGLVMSAAVGAVYARWIEPQRLTTTHLQMNIPNLPERLVGKRLIQLSDFHVSKRSHDKFLRETMARAKSLDPDFVVYTGDFTSIESVDRLGRLEDVMKHVALGKLGTVAVLGNHDYGYLWGDSILADAVCDIVEDAGVWVLRNQMMDLNGLRVVGVDEIWGTNYRPFKAKQLIADTDPHLVLCHQPDGTDLDIWGNYQSWILAGHTHGGQVRAPFLPPIPPLVPIKNKKLWHGLYYLDGGRKLYVNRGLGQTFPFRVSSLPEMTVFTLGASV